MRNICPSCEKVTDIEVIRDKEVIEVRGERIEVDSEYFRCTSCNEDFENTRGYDSHDAAYREYRRRRNLLQPEEIQAWRKGYGLTQREVSRLLGWGGVTLSRYETGALQTEAHERMLRLAMEPHNLLKLIVDSSDVLTVEKRQRLIAELEAAEAESCSFERFFEDQFGKYEPDEFSGYKRLDIERLFAAILFFCRGGRGQLKTKLTKLLFYADFKHFREYAVSVTGARYVHLPLGPVPDNYEYYFAQLIADQSLEAEEVLIGNYVGENFISKKEPDLSMFADSEIKVLSIVKDYFKDHTSTEIKDLSHREPAYRDTDKGQKISYRFAESLQI